MKTRIILVGGFLGSGKTTLLIEAAQRLVKRGYRVGMITNDQGDDLVDTALGREAKVPVTEVAGGCFCCRFPDLLTSLQHLQDSVSPHIILAEPVGSCTDLVATVLRPLVQFYGDQYELAPLTVLLDSNRAVTTFSSEVRYLYQQQLAEAEIILLSKSDLLVATELAKQHTSCQSQYPQASIHTVSAKSGAGLDAWLDIMLGQRSANPEALLIDYERYAEAEARLGWLNAKVQVRADTPYFFRQWTESFLTRLSSQCKEQHHAIAHVKVLLTNPVALMGVVNGQEGETKIKASLVESSRQICWDVEEGEMVGRSHELILNARIDTTPSQLEQMAMRALEDAKPQPTSRYYLDHFECFSPLPPEPHLRI